MSNSARSVIENQWRKRGISGASTLLYESLLVRQKGLCQLCPNYPKGRRLVLDANKTTGKIRGLLCPRCNLQVGQVEGLLGQKERLDQIVNYIAANGEPIVSDAESEIALIPLKVLNPPKVIRQDKAIRRYEELLVQTQDSPQSIEIVAKELGISTRTIRRYLGGA